MGPPTVNPYWLKLEGDFSMPARLFVHVLALSESSCPLQNALPRNCWVPLLVTRRSRPADARPYSAW